MRRRESLTIFKSLNTLWREEKEREGEREARGVRGGKGSIALEGSEWSERGHGEIKKGLEEGREE